MATKRRRKKKPTAPSTPKVRAGFRDPAHVKSVVLRMGDEYIDRLDELCKINQRSRRELVEILVAEASLELQADPSARINPL